MIKDSKRLLFLIVLIEGFISIGVEIFAIRQVVPYVGSNILNTSIIIGVFLLFLSFGYYKGGTIVKDFEKILLNNLINSSILVSLGLSSLYLSWHFSLFENIGNIYGLIAFVFLVVAPITYLLGQTIPIITNFIKYNDNSKINGTLLFLSTVGSFVGSILTSTVLLNYLGVQNTLLVYVFMLCILIFILQKYINLNKIYFYSRVALIFLITLIVNFRDIYGYSNEYSNVNLYEDKNKVRYLNINNSFSSSFNPVTKNSNFKYILKMQDYIKSIDEKKSKNILVIGAGGFTISLNDKINKYTYIDIDEDLKDFSEKYLLKQKINGKFLVDDIRYHFTKDKTKYDIIVLDAFSNNITIPTFLLTQNFFNQIDKHLNTDAILLINFIGSPKFKNAYSRHFNQTVNTLFNCTVEPLEYNISRTNIIYSCVSKIDNVVYTDNKINVLELATKK